MPVIKELALIEQLNQQWIFDVDRGGKFHLIGLLRTLDLAVEMGNSRLVGPEFNAVTLHGLLERYPPNSPTRSL